MTHVTNVHINSGNRQCMQYGDKNEHKKDKNTLLIKTTWYK